MPTKVRSHAKINLGLGIGAPRPDGFHSLATVYQTLELHDVVTVTARPAAATTIRLTSNDARVPVDARNTAWKMVELALKMYGRTAEVDIHIEKNLPVQGGLGAGSANAVAALVGLEVELGVCGGGTALLSRVSESRPGAPGNPATPLIEHKTLDEWGTRTGEPTAVVSRVSESRPGAPGESARRLSGRLEIAAQVGSDVPLFLIGGTVLGLDRGQEVYPLPDVQATWCVVATPDLGVSTAQAFRDWDALCAAEGLTQDASAGKLNELSRAYASAFAGGIPRGGQGAGSSGVLSCGEDLAGPLESALVRTGISSWIENDFERVVFSQQPSLAEIKRLLAGAGTPGASLHASLSGSGSALYGLYLTREDAEAACERLRAAGVKSYLTRTLPRAAYWRDMLSH